MKKFYIAYAAEQDKNERTFTPRENPEYAPGRCAGVISCSESDNLLFTLGSIGGLKAANICQTRKAALELANDWNNSFKANGTYFFA